MDTSTSAGKLMLTLKKELRAKGLHYKDVALRLDVSEGTVKRYFSGKGVTLEVLESMASIVDIDIFSLAILAQQRETEDGMSTSQRASLRRNRDVFTAFSFLCLGFSPDQIAREFNIGKKMDVILSNLESFGLIRRLAKNSVKILVKPDEGGELDEHMEERKVRRIKMTRQILSEMDLHDEKCEWRNSIARLSSASVIRLRELMYRFTSDVLALTKGEISLSPEETQWYRLFVCAEPMSRESIFETKAPPGKDAGGLGQ